MKTHLFLVIIISLFLTSCSSLTRAPSADSSDFVCKGPYKTRFISNSGHADYFATGSRNASCVE